MGRKKTAGRCHCGDVRYVIDGEIEDAFFCHCESCRRSAAAPFVAWGRAHEDQFRLVCGQILAYRSSPKVVRSRCAHCGTEVFYRDEDETPHLDFPLAGLEAPNDVQPRYHVQVAEKLSWITLEDGLPVYQRWRPKGSGKTGGTAK